jgi:hypothetical protein
LPLIIIEKKRRKTEPGVSFFNGHLGIIFRNMTERRLSMSAAVYMVVGLIAILFALISIIGLDYGEIG